MTAASNFTTGARNSSAKLNPQDSGRRASRSAKRGTAATIESVNSKFEGFSRMML